jgi:hypothetical protein
LMEQWENIYSNEGGEKSMELSLLLGIEIALPGSPLIFTSSESLLRITLSSLKDAFDRA